MNFKYTGFLNILMIPDCTDDQIKMLSLVFEVNSYDLYVLRDIVLQYTEFY